MLGYLGYYGATSSVAVPNIINLSTSAASSALSAVGLVLGSSTGVTTSGANSGNNGLVASQSIASGTLVEPGTTVTYTTYNYVAPPSCTAGWTFTGYGEWSAWSTCSNSSQSRSRAILGYYTDSNCNQSGIQQYDTQTETQTCSSCTPGAGCYVGYTCATVGCSFCCPDLCYRSGTWSSGCICQTSGPYFC